MLPEKNHNRHDKYYYTNGIKFTLTHEIDTGNYLVRAYFPKDTSEKEVEKARQLFLERCQEKAIAITSLTVKKSLSHDCYTLQHHTSFTTRNKAQSAVSTLNAAWASVMESSLSKKLNDAHGPLSVPPPTEPPIIDGYNIVAYKKFIDVLRSTLFSKEHYDLYPSDLAQRFILELDDRYGPKAVLHFLKRAGSKPLKLCGYEKSILNQLHSTPDEIKNNRRTFIRHTAAGAFSIVYSMHNYADKGRINSEKSILANEIPLRGPIPRHITQKSKELNHNAAINDLEFWAADILAMLSCMAMGVGMVVDSNKMKKAMSQLSTEITTIMRNEEVSGVSFSL